MVVESKFRMSKKGSIKSVRPRYAIPGGEIEIETEGLQVGSDGDLACFAGGERCRVVAASSKRVLAIVPEAAAGQTAVHLEIVGKKSNEAEIVVGKRIAEEMHIVANPAVDPNDDSIVVTRSGSRGQELPATLYRIEPDGYVDELPAAIMNPTGIAFDTGGEMYVTNRRDGEVCRIVGGEEVLPYATGLGIATGVAFDSDGVMFVGDRSGTIFRIAEFGLAEQFAMIEPSVAAYHLAFGMDGRLYVTAPGLASHETVYAIEDDGTVRSYFRGFGRPQGIAFDNEGNLYAAACYRGRHGIARVEPNSETAEVFLTGNNIVGLCFTRKGEMIVATNDSVFSLDVGIYGTLLP